MNDVRHNCILSSDDTKRFGYEQQIVYKPCMWHLNRDVVIQLRFFPGQNLGTM